MRPTPPKKTGVTETLQCLQTCISKANSPLGVPSASTDFSLTHFNRIMPMATQILLGNPNNLYVFDFGRSGTGSARFNGDENEIEETWDLVQRNVSISGSRGSLYRRPEDLQELTVVSND